MQIAFIGIDLDALHGIPRCSPIKAPIEAAAVLIATMPARNGFPMISACKS
jgi:hypothetical protein